MSSQRSEISGQPIQVARGHARLYCVDSLPNPILFPQAIVSLWLTHTVYDCLAAAKATETGKDYKMRRHFVF